MADNHFSDKPSEGFQIPGKIILFGEYTILTGSRALALPLNQCSGKWTFQKNLEGTSTPFQNELKAFAKYLEQITDLISFTINTEHFLDDLNKGLFFDSNIPIGYGAGSSGAIVAGVCLKYSDLMIDKLTDLAGLKTELGIMENHFHGASSGIDPLISLLNEPILINKNGEILRKNISAIPPRRISQFSYWIRDLRARLDPW